MKRQPRPFSHEIHSLTHLPIKFVVNTHYHLDHVAGNRVFAQQGAVIVGHHNIRAWIHSENLKFFGDKIKPEEKALVANLLAPEVTYDSGVTLFLGARRIDVQLHAGPHRRRFRGLYRGCWGGLLRRPFLAQDAAQSD